MTDIIVKENVELPALPTTVLPAITALTTSLGIPRNVLASDEEIEYAWRDLPRELREIPAELRGELIARMCVAVSTGLFDGAINYSWNAAIINLRQKIRNFGLPVVAQIIQSDFEEKQLLELQDSRLLELCLKLNIIDEDGFFFLDQCRDVRNNFSAAHPTMGKVNDREFTTFLNRCTRYALADSSSPKGVHISNFIAAVKGPRFTGQQCGIWVKRIQDTHEAQRLLLVKMVHGIYCDSATPEPARLNALDICNGLKESISNTIKCELVNNHTDYAARGLEDKTTASLQFFEKLGLLSLLSEADQHSVFYKATIRLWNVHNAMNNFYNEPPFAERLFELTQNGAIPETVQEVLVHVVACCAVGNGYGVSNAAVPTYTKIIQSFSPREIATLIRLAMNQNSDLGRRLSNTSNAKRRLKEVLQLFDPASIPSGVKTGYDMLVK